MSSAGPAVNFRTADYAKVVYRYYEICFVNCWFQEIESSGQNVCDANRLTADRD